MSTKPKFYQYGADVPDQTRAVHVEVSYQTWALNCCGWARWVEADSLERAMNDAMDHVRRFSRCAYTLAASATPGARFEERNAQEVPHEAGA